VTFRLFVSEAWVSLSACLTSTPQYVEVPPNIEVNESFHSSGAVPFVNLTDDY
jgi:hypothetical protein